MNITFPDWALEKYPALTDLNFGLYEILSVLIVNSLPFVSSNQKDKLLDYLLFNPQAQTTVIVSLIFLFAGTVVFILLIWLLNTARKYNQLKQDDYNSIILELRSHHTKEQEPLATKELFKVLHTAINRNSVPYSLEIVSTKREGIRYLLHIPESDRSLVQDALKAHINDLKVTQVEDYLPSDVSETFSAQEYGLTNHYPYPLTTPEQLDIQDPISYMASSMNKLKEGELISLQYLIRPINEKDAKTQAKLLSRIINDEPVFEKIKSARKKSLANSLLLWSTRVILFILIPWLVVAYYLIKLFLKKHRVTYTQGQKELVSKIKHKLEQPLYEVSIRAITKSDSETIKQKKLRKLTAGFSSFNNNFQAIRPLSPSFIFQPFFYKKLHLLSAKKRSFTTANTNFFSTSELAALYHFPNVKSSRVEDLAKTHSKELPPPLSVKNTDFDVVFANSQISEMEISLGLTDEDRSRHVYILGQTGSGKSTIIYHMAKDDIQKGRGVAVIDPHGDLIEDLLKTIPEKRIKECIYLNPYDVSYPIGINILELTPGLKDYELEQEKELVCEGVISIFRRVFSNDEKVNAHRIEYILRNAIYTAFTIPDATIFTVYELLNNPKFQKKATKKLTDEHLKNFWKNEFGKAGNYQIVKMVSGVTAKIGRFLFSPSAKRMLEQPKSTINFDEILDSGKILLCNLAEGKIGEDTSQLLGTTILAKLQQAAVRRALMDVSTREPFYIFVDEFQNFATSSFTKMLSSGRKFGLRMTIAQQTTAQQEDHNVTNVILANTGTVICFRTASPIDAKLMADQFEPYVDKSDINNLPRYNFYIRLAAVEPEEPFSGTTIPISRKSNEELVKKVVASSRQKYAMKYKRDAKKPQQRRPEKKSAKDRKAKPEKSDISTLV